MSRRHDKKISKIRHILSSRQSPALLLVAMLLYLIPARAQTADPPAPASIAILPRDGFNLQVSEQVNAQYVIVTVPPPTHNWFAGAFTNLPVGVPVTIGLCMADNGLSNMPADVSKWVGLRPVFSYADPARYESYEWYMKDADGRWVSGDPFNTGEARYAGAGVVPEQAVIPAEAASKFLSADGRCWSPWREVEGTEVLATINVFRVKQAFDMPAATVAMRVPYTYTYLQSVIARLQQANLPGVFVDELGTTPGGRKLQIIRLTDPDDPRANQHTILATAREHATEPAGSWVVQGMLYRLLSDEGKPLRAHRTWLLLPILDPDGSADAVYERITDLFRKTDVPQTPPEVRQYARYMTRYIADGGQLDLTLSLHNVEATECTNLYCPLMDLAAIEVTSKINTALFADLRARGYVTDDPTRSWYNGFLSFRFYAWCTKRFHALDLVYEVNDRYPDHTLPLEQLARMGGIIAARLAAWCDSDTGRVWHQRAADFLAKHREQRDAYFQSRQRDPEERTLHEMLNLGF